LYVLIIGFCTNSLLVKTRVKSTLYLLILYWSGARHWAGVDTTKSVPFDYRVRFTALLDEEPSLLDPPRSAAELVMSSGELDSPIAHHLHDPSFNTNHLNGAETADETNACIWLIMKNGFEIGKTLIFNHLARRGKPEEVDGIKAYAPDILKGHEDFVESVRKHMLAMVEVVWGAKVRRRMKMMYQSRGNPLEPLQLWGRYKEVKHCSLNGMLPLRLLIEANDSSGSLCS
jgi:hypothetical protein